ncbi:MAG: hypothetical protein ACREJ3_02430, partial [Polyangiaceae bacterium]
SGLARLFGGPDGEPPAETAGRGARRRRELAEALNWGLERGAARARSGIAVLAVDDLDFVDGTSRNAFLDALASPPAVSALVLVTHAPGATLVGEPMDRELWALAPLPYETFADRLPSPMAGAGRPLSPLHVEELLAWARETTEPAPDQLVQIIAQRSARLPPEARHALHALAAWGDDAKPDVLQSILGKDIDVGSALDALVRARMIVVRARGARFAHPLIRRVVFSGIPVGRKEELYVHVHRLRPDAPLDVRAKQALHAGRGLEALSLLDALSVRRSAQGDLAGSVSALRNALDLARRDLHRGDLDDPVSAILIFARKLADALLALNRRSDAAGVLREALSNAPPASEHRAPLQASLDRIGRTSDRP